MSPVPAAEELEYEDAEGDESAYRSLSLTAVLGLLFGVVAVGGLWHPVFLPAAVVGLLLSATAVRRIATAIPPPVGRGAALAGLALSLIFGVATAASVVYRAVVLEREAQEIARAYLDYLTEGEYTAAQQLSQPEAKRARPQADLWDYYLSDAKAQAALRTFVEQPAVRSLVSLGDRARVRHYQTESRERVRGIDTINQVYAVTYEDEGEERTFFISLKLIHAQDEITRRYGWAVTDPLAGVLPKSWVMEPQAKKR